MLQRTFNVKVIRTREIPSEIPRSRQYILYTTWIIVGLLLMADIHINIKHITSEFESGIGSSKQIKILANGNNRWWVSTNHKHTHTSWLIHICMVIVYLLRP